MAKVENDNSINYVKNNYEENKRKSDRIIRFRTLMASGVGFLPFPILDAAGILSIQLWMIRDIAKVYDVPFRKNIARSIITSLIGNVGTISIVKLIPGINVIGSGAMAVSAGASTYALGKVFIQHFDQGGTLLSFDPIKSRAYFQQVFEEGKVTVKELQNQEDSFKEVDSQALASIVALKKANRDLMSTINNLEIQLKESKKERAVAMAVAKSRAKPLPSIRRKRRGFLWWFYRVLIVILIGGVSAFAFFKFDLVKDFFDKKDNEETIENSEKPKNSENHSKSKKTNTASIINTETPIDTAYNEISGDTIYNDENAVSTTITEIAKDTATTQKGITTNNENSTNTNNQASEVVPQDTSSRTD